MSNDDTNTEDNWDDMEEEETETDWEDGEEEETESVGSEDAEEDEEETDPPVEVDPDDETVFPEQFYTTTTANTIDDKEVPAGTSIPVRCENCAVWETPLTATGGKTLCRPGLRTVVPLGEDETHKWRMAPHRYSCQQYFVPKELDDVLTHVTDDPDYVRAILWAFPAIKALGKLQDRINGYYKRHNLGDPSKAIEGALDFAMLFRSKEQADFVRPFVKYVYDNVKVRKQPPSRRKDVFQPGADVEWDDTGSGKRVSGFIQSIGGSKRLVTMFVTGDNAMTLSPKKGAEWKANNPDVPIEKFTSRIRYKFSEWKETRNPSVVSEAAVAIDDFDDE